MESRLPLIETLISKKAIEHSETHLLLNRSHHISKTLIMRSKLFAISSFSGRNKLSFTMDITSLYTVIPNHEGLLSVARYFNLPNHSQKHMAVCGLSLHLGNTESRKNIEQKFIFQIGTLSPCGINERFSFLQLSYIILLFVSTYYVAPPSLYK